MINTKIFLRVIVSAVLMTPSVGLCAEQDKRGDEKACEHFFTKILTTYIASAKQHFTGYKEALTTNPEVFKNLVLTTGGVGLTTGVNPIFAFPTLCHIANQLMKHHVPNLLSSATQCVLPRGQQGEDEKQHAGGQDESIPSQAQRSVLQGPNLITVTDYTTTNAFVAALFVATGSAIIKAFSGKKKIKQKNEDDEEYL